MKKAGLIIMAILNCAVLFSQDIHFSQFYASPLTLNPALTGRMAGDYRLAGIYRGQYKSFTSDPSFNPYATPAASFDIPFIIGKKRTSALGAGILFVNDITNNKRLNTLQVQASVAYIKVLDKKFKHQLSIGLQGGIRQTNVKSGDLKFASQFNSNGVYDPNLPGETSLGGSKTIPDINAGIFYSGMVMKKLTLFTGVSVFHLGEPDQSLFTNDESKLAMRYAVHGGLDWKVTDRISLLPGVIYMTQAKAREINYGVNLGYDLFEKPGKEAAIFIGLWHRWDDAIIPMLALELMKRFRVGVSYDVSVSDVTDITNSRGGFEVSLIYTGNILRVNQTKLFCPRF